MARPISIGKSTAPKLTLDWYSRRTDDSGNNLWLIADLSRYRIISLASSWYIATCTTDAAKQCSVQYRLCWHTLSLLFEKKTPGNIPATYLLNTYDPIISDYYRRQSRVGSMECISSIKYMLPDVWSFSLQCCIILFPVEFVLIDVCIDVWWELNI